MDSSIDTYEISVISVDAGNTRVHCVPEIVSSLLCKVQLLFTYQGVYTHYYTLLPLIATLVALVNILFVRSFVDTYNTKVL